MSVSDAEVEAAALAMYENSEFGDGPPFAQAKQYMRESFLNHVIPALEAAARVRENAEPLCWVVVADMSEVGDLVYSEESYAQQCADEEGALYPESKFTVTPLFATPRQSEPSVPLSVVAAVLAQIQTGHYLATEAAPGSAYGDGCRDAYDSAIGIVQRAFPQLKEHSNG